MKKHLVFVSLVLAIFSLGFLVSCAQTTETSTTTTTQAGGGTTTTQSGSGTTTSTVTTTTASVTSTTIQMGGGIQGNPLNLSAAVTTIAGTAGQNGTTDATGVNARFYLPAELTTDGSNLYVADSGSHTIRKMVIASGVVTTIAGTGGQSGHDDGTGAVARFWSPLSLVTDGTNLFVADTTNHIIRKIVIASGVVTTIAGTANQTGSADGTGTAARFWFPSGLTTDGINLYIADTSNNTIRQMVIASGAVTTIAGTAGQAGSTDGTGTAALFNCPYGITTDGTNLYVADTSNHTIRQIVIASGAVTTIAGTAGQYGTSEGTGTAARFRLPHQLTTDGTNLFVADYGNHAIRKMVLASGTVTTIAGTAGQGGSTDGTGTAALFNYPFGIITDDINLYVTCYDSYTIRKIQ